MVKVSLWSGKYSLYNTGSGWKTLTGHGAELSPIDTCKLIQPNTLKAVNIGREENLPFQDVRGNVISHTKIVYECIPNQKGFKTQEDVAKKLLLDVIPTPTPVYTPQPAPSVVVTDRPLPADQEVVKLIKPTIQTQTGTGGAMTNEHTTVTTVSRETAVMSSGDFLDNMASNIGVSKTTLIIGISLLLYLLFNK